MRLPLILAAALAAASCTKPAPAPKPVEPISTFHTEIPVKEVMAHVMEPAAFQFWNGSGWEATRAGVRDRTPTTDEGWTTVENGAATVVEASNTLLLPGRARPPAADWNRYANALGNVALRAKDAAERRDRQALWSVGIELDHACEACHKQYLPQ